ncbi:MAG: hypothetical protein AAFU57_18405 [Bacteroidota bacterium]
MEKKIIGFDEGLFAQTQKRQKDFDEAKADLVALADQVLPGEGIKDYTAFMTEPCGYLIDRFFELYGSNEPPNVDKKKFMFGKISVPTTEMDEAKRKCTQACTAMKKFAPIITKKGSRVNFKKDDFNIYLNPEKAAEYDLLETYANAVNNLLKTHRGTTALGHAMKVHPDVMSKNGEIVVNHTKYRL